MKVGSLCTGIMGAELALEIMGCAPELAWYFEIDPHACTVIARHTDAPNLGDLTAVDWSQVEPVDVLTAGYPCQPFSLAGRRKGTDDERHLWPYIAECIRVLRPRLVLLENVAAHLSLGFGNVLGDLARLRYDASWTCLRAADIGAPHGRNRVFIAAYPEGAGSGLGSFGDDDRGRLANGSGGGYGPTTRKGTTRRGGWSRS